MQTLTTACLVCGADLTAAPDTLVSELLECGDCGSEFEVTGVQPLVLVEAPIEAEDWGQ